MLRIVSLRTILAITAFLEMVHVLKAQDTPFIYKVHFISAADLRNESEMPIGAFISGNDSNRRKILFLGNRRFEEHTYYGIDSFLAKPGSLATDPGGWYVLSILQQKDRRFVIMNFYKFSFLIEEKEIEQFKIDFESNLRGY